MKARIWGTFAFVGVVGFGCGGSDPDGPSGSNDGWEECTEERDSWERCDNGDVIWCHVFGDPHFHSGARCEAASLTCIEVDERRAVCADPANACEDGTYRCEGNTALNCVDGILAEEPCGTRKECVADGQAGVATCYDPRPNAPCSGFGDLYASGCVCFRGYRPTADEEGCVPDA
ncbi:MAG TPA: hypothetical protein RMG48_12655 [Myxococcales bacterium LLY-WYZ-16_1]|nr:hypothetical protein [Myxococcales bacterium LLY-WYZ-16_1]